MKSNSDNFKTSAIHDIINKLKKENVEIVIYEPNLSTCIFNGCSVANDTQKFDDMVDIVLVNRMDEQVNVLTKEIYTRDIFNRD